MTESARGNSPESHDAATESRLRRFVWRHFEVIRDDEVARLPTMWMPFNGGVCVSWRGTTVWTGRWTR